MHWMGQNGSGPMIERWKDCTNKIDPKNNTHIPFTKGEGVHMFTYNNTHIWIFSISILKAKK
jgi:hypothetical protein